MKYWSLSLDVQRITTGVGSERQLKVKAYFILGILWAATFANSALIVLEYYAAQNGKNQARKREAFSYRSGYVIQSLSCLILLADAFRRIKKSADSRIAIKKSQILFHIGSFALYASVYIALLWVSISD